MKVPLIINAMHAYLDVCRGEKKQKQRGKKGHTTIIIKMASPLA